MKNKVHIFLLIISLVLIPVNYRLSKININSVSNEQMKSYFSVLDGVGDKTFIKVTEQNYNLEDLGDKKYKIINKRFKTDGVSIRFELFIISLIIMITSNVVSVMFILDKKIRQIYLKDAIKKKIQQINKDGIP